MVYKTDCMGKDRDWRKLEYQGKNKVRTTIYGVYIIKTKC